MTRINTVPVQLLTDPHLIAEYRELPMVNASLRRTLNSKKGLVMESIPAQYTLNKGHVTFHYDKGLYLFNRFNKLVAELRNRGYNVNPGERTINWDIFHAVSGLWNDWQPTDRDCVVNVERIVTRIDAKPHWYKYNKKPIGFDFVEVNYGKWLTDEQRGQRLVPL